MDIITIQRLERNFRLGMQGVGAIVLAILAVHYLGL